MWESSVNLFASSALFVVVFHENIICLSSFDFFYFFCFVAELTDYYFHLVPSERWDEAQIIELDVSVCMYL